MGAVIARALLLLVVTLFACWPMWSLPDLDGTEGRRVQIALEMLRSGDWLVPSLGQEPTWAKPPLFYWLLALCEHWLGSSWWCMRLPSVLGAWAAALLAGELLRRHFGAHAGWLGALGIACSPLVLAVWPTAEIDPLFATFTAGSLWCLACGVAGERRGLVLASGVLAGLALLQKGPPFFLFAAGAYVVWWRERRLRGFLWHVVPLLLLPLAYYVPLWVLRVAPSETLKVAGEESIGRLLATDWEHIKPIPQFWLRAIAVQLPFVLWIRSDWCERRGDDNERAGDLVRRMCTWSVCVPIVVLTFFPGRPTRYLQPNALVLTFALAPAVAHFARSAAPLPRFARGALVAIGVAASASLLALPFAPKVGVAAIGLGAAAAVGAAGVRTPRQVVALCLVLPVVAAWTVALDRSRGWLDQSRARAPWAAVWRRELDRLGVDPAQLATVGHFDSPLLLAMGLLPPGDENADGEWRSHWVLHEDSHDDSVDVAVPANYAARSRLDLPFKSFVLRERVGTGR